VGDGIVVVAQHIMLFCLETGGEGRHYWLTGFATRPPGRSSSCTSPSSRRPNDNPPTTKTTPKYNRQYHHPNEATMMAIKQQQQKLQQQTATKQPNHRQKAVPSPRQTSWHDDHLLAQARTVNRHVLPSYDEVPPGAALKEGAPDPSFHPRQKEAAMTMHLIRVAGGCLSPAGQQQQQYGWVFLTAIFKKRLPR
jgi:hypothetical protein